MVASSNNEKELWIGAIGKIMSFLLHVKKIKRKIKLRNKSKCQTNYDCLLG